LASQIINFAFETDKILQDDTDSHRLTAQGCQDRNHHGEECEVAEYHVIVGEASEGTLHLLCTAETRVATYRKILGRAGLWRSPGLDRGFSAVQMLRNLEDSMLHGIHECVAKRNCALLIRIDALVFSTDVWLQEANVTA
jgi:hypothetical protein